MKNKNKLIAEFMLGQGLVKVSNNIYSTVNELDVPDDSLTVEDLQYHTSWDWLMDVVNKIEEIALEEVEGAYKMHRFNVKIESFHCIITDAKDEYRELIVADDGDKKSNTYYAVVEFIKWYNENK